MRKFIILAAVLGTAAASAQGVDDLPNRPIPRSEVVVVVKRQFAAMDRNHDGVVDSREFEAYRAVQSRTPPSATAAFDHIGGHWFERADAAGDGRVTLREAMARPLKLFDLADSDSDGVVSVRERDLAAMLMSLGK